MPWMCVYGRIALKKDHESSTDSASPRTPGRSRTSSWICYGAEDCRWSNHETNNFIGVAREEMRGLSLCDLSFSKLLACFASDFLVLDAERDRTAWFAFNLWWSGGEDVCVAALVINRTVMSAI
ncbi:hypothetical protein DOTSEDRAFT_72301 [Dothistroma septosporum NZE10]|uniref:Uncharacterized protein n=1 Tax=Dothistroma septosporum (strain NZE10 / CBS 128990) TaxID=675120 RepID=N1PQX3_DOTSN|nr:hypothetical protein DOTSEDRAFT_72301 [Dothistroma septosporum NZE10]